MSYNRSQPVSSLLACIVLPFRQTVGISLLVEGAQAAIAAVHSLSTCCGRISSVLASRSVKVACKTLANGCELEAGWERHGR